MAVAANETWYQYPNATDSRGYVELFNYINQAAGNLFFFVILWVIWFISFVTTFNAGGNDRPAAARGFLFASFLTSVLSILVSTMDFLNSKFMYLFFIMFAGGVLWVKLESATYD